MILRARLYQLRTRSMASTSYQVCEHAPQVFFKSRTPKRGRVLQDHFQQGATPLCFSIQHGTQVFAENQQASGDSCFLERFCPK